MEEEGGEGETYKGVKREYKYDKKRKEENEIWIKKVKEARKEKEV